MRKTMSFKKYLIYAAYSFISGFILASGITLYTAAYTGSNIFYIQSAGEIKTVFLVILWMIFSLMLFLVFKLRKSVYRCSIPLSLFIFSMLSLWNVKSQYPYFYIVLAATVIGATLVYKEIFHDRRINFLKGKGLYITVLIMTTAMTSILTMGNIVRMYTFNSSTFDFGLFAQMYESMATDFSQNTTLERNELLSHFAVHFSPIYYLLLPFYMIFRRPEFLFAAQAAVCFSGIIPVLLLCKRWKYREGVTLLISAVFLCYPAFTGACFYDFHENVFLVPLILWLLYFTEKNSNIGMCVSALLLLCVKEDAGLYIIFIALYALFNKKIRKFNAVCLLLTGVFGFISVTAFINAYGEGIKVSRYDIFLYGNQSSLTDVVINVIKNPAFFFSKLLNENKLVFLLQMFLPLLFIPMRSRRLSDWLLIAPLILINLATDYTYQSDIGYQYVFGTGAILIFLFVKNLRYSKTKTKVAAAAFMASAICLVGHNMPKYRYIDRLAGNGGDYYAAARQVLSEIPRDKTIYASTYLTPFLFDCKEVYMYPPIYNKQLTGLDYVILDSRGADETEFSTLIRDFEDDGYEIVNNQTFITVLKLKENK